MDLTSVISSFPNVSELPAPTSAWHWSPNPRFHFAGALTSSGDRLLQMNSRDGFDEELASAVLTFAREHEGQLVGGSGHFRVAEGFRAAGHDFDAVAATAPEVHRHYEYENPELMRLTYIVFPADHCEFSGTESLEEAGERYKRMLDTAHADRTPVPFLKMRFDNPKTGVRSTSSDRKLALPRTLVNELREMEDAPGSFVEFENHGGSVMRVAWDDGTWQVSDAVSGDGDAQNLGLEEVLALAEARLRA